MQTLQFEAVKVALKQDKSGYILNLSIHPDDLPEPLMRDFVGARYMVVMVRVNETEGAMDRQEEFQGERAIRMAGILCRDPEFWKYLFEDNQILEPRETEATDWLRDYLNIPSRSDLKTNEGARLLLEKLQRDFNTWKQEN